jgi:hypothetical protein
MGIFLLNYILVFWGCKTGFLCIFTKHLGGIKWRRFFFFESFLGLLGTSDTMTLTSCAVPSPRPIRRARRYADIRRDGGVSQGGDAGEPSSPPAEKLLCILNYGWLYPVQWVQVGGTPETTPPTW